MKIEFMMRCFHIYTEFLLLLTKSIEATFTMRIFNIWCHFSFHLFKGFLYIWKSWWISHIRFYCIELSLNILFIFPISNYASTSFSMKTFCSFRLFNTSITVICTWILKWIKIKFAREIKQIIFKFNFEFEW
jgi:hypothetical protein